MITNRTKGVRVFVKAYHCYRSVDHFTVYSKISYFILTLTWTEFIVVTYTLSTRGYGFVPEPMTKFVGLKKIKHPNICYGLKALNNQPIFVLKA